MAHGGYFADDANILLQGHASRCTFPHLPSVLCQAEIQCGRALLYNWSDDDFFFFFVILRVVDDECFLVQAFRQMTHGEGGSTTILQAAVILLASGERGRSRMRAR